MIWMHTVPHLPDVGSNTMTTLLCAALLAESFWEKKHPVFGVSFGTLLLIWFVMNELKKNQK